MSILRQSRCNIISLWERGLLWQYKLLWCSNRFWALVWHRKRDTSHSSCNWRVEYKSKRLILPRVNILLLFLCVLQLSAPGQFNYNSSNHTTTLQGEHLCVVNHQKLSVYLLAFFWSKLCYNRPVWEGIATRIWRPNDRYVPPTRVCSIGFSCRWNWCVYVSPPGSWGPPTSLTR